MKKPSFVFLLLLLVFSFIYFKTNTQQITYARPVTNSVNKTNKSDVSDFQKAFQEIAFSYYMRGVNIQYNSLKRAVFSPEEATCQNMKYMVCSALPQNIYRELFGIVIPPYTESLLKYGRENVGRQEVIAYGHKDDAGNLILQLYDPSVNGHVKTINNPELRDLLPYLHCGDVLTYTGHAVVVYDLLYDADGTVIDAYIMQSSHGNRNFHVNTKIPKKTSINTIKFGSANHYLYHNSRVREVNGKKMQEGSLNLVLLSGESNWSKIHTDAKKQEYSVLRFVHADLKGNTVLHYSGSAYRDKDYNGEPIRFTDTTKSRLMFPSLYIEKSVDAHAGNVVEAGDTLTYTILIKNNSNSTYNNDLKITEDISEFVEYTNTGNDSKPKQVEWNVGKLKSNEEVKIQYTVTVKSNNKGKLIVSTGRVGNIPSAVIKNPIGVNLTSVQAKAVKDRFASIKGNSNFKSKALINEVYKQALGIDLQLDSLEISELIQNRKQDSKDSNTLLLNTRHSLYPAVLNCYWSSLYEKPFNYKTKSDVIAYDLKSWGSYDNPARRADTIYSKSFKTGDILIYKNTNDVIYNYKEGKLLRRPVTFENGEYAFIFIEGKGFVGVNCGNDNIPGTSDDRNEFNVSYYRKNNLSVYSNVDEKDESFLEFANYQSLFGKDYYVILRPALLL